MPRRLSPEKQQELDDLCALLRVLVEFKRTFLEPRIGERMMEAVEGACEAGNLTGLRMVRDDMMAMLDADGSGHLRALDVLLRERLGITVDDLRARQRARIAKVRERGRITTEDQYYMIRERVEVIWDDPAKAEEFQALQGMMVAYEDRAARRGGRS
jgi:hypothetical protein